MELQELKPLLTTLVLPPAGPLLLALAGLLLNATRRLAGRLVAFTGIASLWFLSCNAVAVHLAGHLLPQVPPISAAQLAQVQAIVVLGGGVRQHAPDYGAPQLNSYSYQRLRYGVRLARLSGKPLAFAGGVGWGGTGTVTEAQVARRVAQEDYGMAIRWVEDRSRDTAENARLAAELMHPEQVRTIAVVTDSWHMPRSIRAFERAGFKVVPAPTAYPHSSGRPDLEWLPSEQGLATSRQVLREWLGLRLT